MISDSHHFQNDFHDDILLDQFIPNILGLSPWSSFPLIECE